MFGHNVFRAFFCLVIHCSGIDLLFVEIAIISYVGTSSKLLLQYPPLQYSEVRVYNDSLVSVAVLFRTPAAS